MLYNIDVINRIKDFLIDKKQTLSVAESVTSGHLQAAFSAATLASKFFQGGITTYNIGQKSRHLKIEPIHAEDCNCVAERVACDMAINVNKMFSSDYGIAITGFATIAPEMNVEALYAYSAIAYKSEIAVIKKIDLKEEKDSVAVQLFYANEVIKEFDNLLRKKK
jgi:PncC family amidohydrolase